MHGGGQGSGIFFPACKPVLPGRADGDELILLS